MDIHEEIREALGSQGDGTVAFEQIQDEGDSPLNQPVVPPKSGQQKSETTEEHPDPDEQDYETDHEYDDTLDDALEQEIDENYQEDAIPGYEAEFKIPDSNLGDGTDALLGMTNNMLAFGGGFFVKIRKDEAFYEFDEVIQVIEKQNKKNIKRLKLDKEDKALLRPLMIAVGKKRAKKLSPEQLLVGAILTIIIKKGKAVMEIKAENEILEDRIREIIREEKGYMEDDYEEDDGKDQEQEDHPEEKPETPVAETQTVSADQVMEVAEDTPPKKPKKQQS